MYGYFEDFGDNFKFFLKVFCVFFIRVYNIYEYILLFVFFL